MPPDCPKLADEVVKAGAKEGTHPLALKSANAASAMAPRRRVSIIPTKCSGRSLRNVAVSLFELPK